MMSAGLGEMVHRVAHDGLPVMLVLPACGPLSDEKLIKVLHRGLRGILGGAGHSEDR
jgi:hypothetical protein